MSFSSCCAGFLLCQLLSALLLALLMFVTCFASLSATGAFGLCATRALNPLQKVMLKNKDRHR